MPRLIFVRYFVTEFIVSVVKVLFMLYTLDWHGENLTYLTLRSIDSSNPFYGKLECGPMPNVMVALPNIGGALCSTPQFGWRPQLECRAVTLPRRQPRWNLQGCPKLTKRSQPLVGRSSPYYEDMWRRYCCLKFFFPIVDTCLVCKDIARRSCAMVPRWRFLVPFLRPT